MKRVKFLSKNFVLIILFFCFSISLTAQIKTLGEFFAGGVSDAGKLFEAYITPWANSIGTSLSGGWYNTAKPHKLGGFDITFTTNISFVPEDGGRLRLPRPMKSLQSSLLPEPGARPLYRLFPWKFRAYDRVDLDRRCPAL